MHYKWLNLQVQNHRHRGSTIKLYSDFQLHRKLVTLTPHTVQTSTVYSSLSVIHLLIMSVYLFLGSLFCSIDLCVCFSAGTILSCLIQFCGEGNGNPLQCDCLENPRDGGAWWAAVYGVAQSRTRLKQLSSSSSIVWNQWTWCLHICSSFSRLFWLFKVYCDSTQILGLFSKPVKNTIGILIGITLNL